MQEDWLRASKVRRLECFGWLLIAVLVVVAVCLAPPAAAQQPPRAAIKYRADLTRTAHAAWGLDAPVAAFAAQIHQESGWNLLAVSRVGALGMAQFMPETAKWWCAKTGTSIIDCQPSNPIWAMRALVGYDRWLFERVEGSSDYDRLWAALRAYNGGLGHWQQEAKVAGSVQREAVDLACGTARRSRQFCPENLGYPYRILDRLQPLYFAWGLEVLP